MTDSTESLPMTASLEHYNIIYTNIINNFILDVCFSHLGRTPEQKYCLRSLKHTMNCHISVRFSQRAQPTVMIQAVTSSVMRSLSSTDCSVASTQWPLATLLGTIKHLNNMHTCTFMQWEAHQN